MPLNPKLLNSPYLQLFSKFPIIMFLIATAIFLACTNNVESSVQISETTKSSIEISCSSDIETKTIDCLATGYPKGSEIRWESNATSRMMGGTPIFNFEIEKFVDTSIITFNYCLNDECQSENITIDTSDIKSIMSNEYPNQNKQTNYKQNQDSSSRSGGGYDETKYPVTSPENCSGFGSVIFANSPMNLKDVDRITPYGQVVGAHVTPIDHMYFEPKDRSLGRDVYEVRAIQDGTIYDITRREIFTDTNTKMAAPDWRIDIAHSCDFTSYFDLMTSVIPEIEQALKNKKEGSRFAVPVQAGQIVGYVGAQTLDFGVYDYSVTLPGFITPDLYSLEPWKVHTVSPFEYFPEPIKARLIEKMIRKVEPFAGKIDYDIDGTPSGNWFEENTGGYSGIDPYKYWDGHLSIFPDAIDPTFWVSAIGYLETYSNAFIIEGNVNPPDIEMASGPVKYQLFNYDYYLTNDPSRKYWEEPTRPGDIFGTRAGDYAGTLLIEMIEPRLMRAEVFLDEAPKQDYTFSNSSRLYTR